MNRTTKDFLQAIKNLLQDRNAWTQGTFARDDRENSTYPRGPHAVCFCLVGAVSKVTHNLADEGDVVCALDSAAVALFPDRVREAFVYGAADDGSGSAAVAVNDHDDTLHKDILQIIDYALEQR